MEMGRERYKGKGGKEALKCTYVHICIYKVEGGSCTHVCRY